MRDYRFVFGAIALVMLISGCASIQMPRDEVALPETPELVAIQSYDLAQWAKVQLQRGADERERGMIFPGLQIYPLSDDELKAISQEEGRIGIVSRPASSAKSPYLAGPTDVVQKQTFLVDIDEVRFNKAETLPYGFRINAVLPFAVLPSTSARMSGVRVVVPTFAKFSEADDIVPVEMALGKIDDLEFGGWHLKNAWVLIAKTIRDGRGRLIQHTLGMDVIVATGGLRVTADQKALFGEFDSTSCTGLLQWGSSPVSSRFLMMRSATDSGWERVIPAAKDSLGLDRFIASSPLQANVDLLQNFSRSGGGIDTRNMRHCAPQGVTRVVTDGAISAVR